MTPETNEGNTSRRFVVLEHVYDPHHFDLMLERSDCLWTWSLYRESFPEFPERLELEKIQDHRKKYLDYEGPVSGDRGRVERVDSGTYELDLQKEERLEGSFTGSDWNFSFVLKQSSGSGRRDFSKWVLENRDFDPPDEKHQL